MKVALLDADGVLLKKHSQYFSERFCNEYGAPAEQVRAFFGNEFKLCQTGKLDLKDELAKRLPAWNWSGTVEEFLDYWFSNDTAIDEATLEVVKTLRAKGVDCYLATDQEKYRAQYIADLLDGQLTGFWFSSDLGYSKSEPEFFKEVVKRLGVEPQDVMYWDDDQHNVDSALSVGIDAHFYRSIEDLQRVV